MRISWLEPDVVARTRAALRGYRGSWHEFFLPAFDVPPTPTWAVDVEWARIAEHVARAERVSEVVREGGFDAAWVAFGGSSHAIELATVGAAAAQIHRIDLDLLDALLACPIDDLVAYGGFLTSLHHAARDDPERAVAIYERFSDAFSRATSRQTMWDDRVGAVRDGLAALYVRCGRYDDGHAVFLARHEDQATDLVVALAASRSFLSAGAVGRAVQWLGFGAVRAEALGRKPMAARLRAKQDALRKRQS